MYGMKRAEGRKGRVERTEGHKGWLKRAEGHKGRVERTEGHNGWLKRAEGHKILGAGSSTPLFWSSWNTGLNDFW